MSGYGQSIDGHVLHRGYDLGRILCWESRDDSATGRRPAAVL